MSTTPFQFNPYKYSNQSVYNPDTLNLNMGKEKRGWGGYDNMTNPFQYPGATTEVADADAKPPYEDQNGNPSYRSDKAVILDADPASTAEILAQKAGNIAPAAIAGFDIAKQFQMYKQIRDAKANITPRMYGPTYSRIAAKTGLPWEAKQAGLNRIDQQVSQVKSSDPTMQMVEKLGLASQKQQARDQITSADSMASMQDKQRYDQQIGQQQQQNAAIRQANLGKLEARDKTINRAEVNYLDNKRKLWGNVSQQGIEALNKEGRGNYKAEMLGRQNRITSYNNRLNRIQSDKANLDTTTAAGILAAADLDAAALPIQKLLDKELAQNVWSPSDIRGTTFLGYNPNQQNLVSKF